MNEPFETPAAAVSPSTAAAGPTVYELEIPLVDNKPPLNANQRLAWYVHRQRVVLVRNAVEWRVKQERIPPAQHVNVGLIYRVGDQRKRDASNLMPTQKPAVDALVRAGVVPDDSATWVTERMPEVQKCWDDAALRSLVLRVEVVL